MSLASWKKEFYGPMGKATKSERAALEHSIKKWTGLLPSNLKKHGLEVNWFGEIGDGEGAQFWIDDSTCALCEKYSDPCERCPLYRVRDKTRCDRERLGEKRAPYHSWPDTPRPMLRWLLKARDMLDAKGRK